MPAEPKTDAQAILERPTVNQTESLARWIELGRDALRVARPAKLRSLQEILAELRSLVVYEHWLSTGQNTTRTAADLGTSRRSVRMAIQARVRAPDTEEDA